MTDTTPQGSQFEGETFKGELKTYFDRLHISGDFQRLLREVAAKHFNLPVDVFKRDGSKRGPADVSLARKKLIYVLNTFLIKNGKDNHPTSIGKKIGRDRNTILNALQTIDEQLAEETKQGVTTLKDDITLLTLKVIQRVMETSPIGRRIAEQAEIAELPTRPGPPAPIVAVDTANVARKG